MQPSAEPVSPSEDRKKPLICQLGRSSPRTQLPAAPLLAYTQSQGTTAKAAKRSILPGIQLPRRKGSRSFYLPAAAISSLGDWLLSCSLRKSLG